MLAQRWANVGVQPLGQRWANWQIHVGPTLVSRRWPNVRLTLGQRWANVAMLAGVSMTDRQHLLHIILHTLERRLSMSSYLVPGIARSAEDLMHDVSCRTWPSGLMTAKSYDSESEGALSWSLVPQIQQITEHHCGGAAAGQSYLVPRLTTMEHSRADTDHIHIAALLEWEMPTGEDGQKLHIYIGSRKWPPHQAWFHQHPFQSLVYRRWAQLWCYMLRRYSLGQQPVK